MRHLACIFAVTLTSCAAEHPAVDAASRDGATSALGDADRTATTDAFTPTFADGGSLVATHCLPAAVPSNGFVANEVYVESNHPACGGGPCIVFHLAGNPACAHDDARCAGPGASACFDGDRGVPLCMDVDAPGISTAPTSPDRAFCSCRCGEGGNSSLPLCACSADARCVPDAEPGGGYCVPAAL